MRKRDFIRASAAALALPSLALAADPPYPSKPLRFVVNNPPGGASDIMARIFGQKFGDILGQTVVIDNRPGATVGTVYVSHAPADGYTFMLGAFGPTIAQPLLSKVSYDVGRDFMPVSLIATAPVVMVVNGSVAYRDLKGFVAAARAKAAGFNYGTGGNGTLAHLLCETINLTTGLRMQHVPYRGSVQALNDLMAGQLDMVLADPQAIQVHVRSGKLRAIAVTSPERFSLMPDVPTFAESGMPELTALNPWAIYLPAGVPEPVFSQFRRALETTMTDPDVVKKFTELGVDAKRSTPQELKTFLATESAKYEKIIRERNIKAD